LSGHVVDDGAPKPTPAPGGARSVGSKGPITNGIVLEMGVDYLPSPPRPFLSSMKWCPPKTLIVTSAPPIPEGS